MINCLLVTDLFQPRLCRGGPCNFPRSWLLPVLKDNVKDTELKYFFDVMLPLSANLRNKGNTEYVKNKKMLMLTLVVGQWGGAFMNIQPRRRPFYSCLFSDLAFERR